MVEDNYHRIHCGTSDAGVHLKYSQGAVQDCMEISRMWYLIEGIVYTKGAKAD